MTNKLIKHDFIKHFVSSMFNTMTFSANTIFRSDKYWLMCLIFIARQYKSTHCLRIISPIFPITTKSACDRSAEDAQFSMATDSTYTSNFCIGTCLLCSFIFSHGSFDFKYFSFDNSFIRYKLCSGWHSLLFFVICQ